MIVSIICPCRNEAARIDSFLSCLLAQECERFELEILVADGMSVDGTTQKLNEWAARDQRVHIFSNRRQIVSTGLNIALAHARGEFIVRMDVHTSYAADYVKQSIKALQETQGTCVGGPWVARGVTLKQRAIAAAFQSRFGSGGASSRSNDYNGPVDTVYLGAWRREDLIRLGGFDETLARNQDDELNLRIIRSGGSVWQSSAIRSTYEPRSSLTALLFQFHQYGYWKVPVIQKHRRPASMRHVVPFGLLAIIVVLATLAPITAASAWLLGSIFVAYGSTALLFALYSRTAVGSWAGIPVVVAAFACIHVGYASGFGRGLWDFVLMKRCASPSMTRLTR